MPTDDWDRKEAKYCAYRQEAYWQMLVNMFLHAESEAEHRLAIDTFPCHIDLVSLAYWEQHWPPALPPGMDGGWDWRAICRQIGKYPDRFEIAVWHSQILCGMAIGKPSSGPDNLTLEFLERYWGENPLKGRVALILLDAADSYARLLGKQFLKLKEPCAGAIPYYESLGFVLADRVAGATYYQREVSNDGAE